MINYILKALTIIIVFTLLLNGCATTQNLLTTKYYSKETVPNHQTYFKQIWAVEDDGKFRVSGKLRLKKTSRFHIPNYIEVALLDQKGVEIETQKVLYYPRVLTGRRKKREARFSAYFSKTPPSGSIIQLSNVN